MIINRSGKFTLFFWIRSKHLRIMAFEFNLNFIINNGLHFIERFLIVDFSFIMYLARSLRMFAVTTFINIFNRLYRNFIAIHCFDNLWCYSWLLMSITKNYLSLIGMWNSTISDMSERTEISGTAVILRTFQPTVNHSCSNAFFPSFFILIENDFLFSKHYFHRYLFDIICFFRGFGWGERKSFRRRSFNYINITNDKRKIWYQVNGTYRS